MQRINPSTAALLITVMVFAAPLQAEELRYTVEVDAPAYDGGWINERTAVPTFPSRLGTLTGVRMELDVEFRQAVGLENLAPVPTFGQVALIELFLARPLHHPDPLIVQCEQMRYFDLPEFDGVIDFAGRSGETTRLSEVLETEMDYPVAREWSDTTGLHEVPIEVATYADLYCGASSDPAAMLWGHSDVVISVIYTYDPHPGAVCRLLDGTGGPLDPSGVELRAREESAEERALLG